MGGDPGCGRMGRRVDALAIAGIGAARAGAAGASGAPGDAGRGAVLERACHADRVASFGLPVLTSGEEGFERMKDVLRMGRV